MEMNSTALLGRGMACLTRELGLLEAEQFVFTLLSEPFDYTQWRRDNLPAGSVADISAAAEQYCSEHP
jgi:hypothetical protein